MVWADKIGVGRKHVNNLKRTTSAVGKFIDGASGGFGLNGDVNFNTIANFKSLLFDRSIMAEAMTGTTFLDEDFSEILGCWLQLWPC